MIKDGNTFIWSILARPWSRRNWRLNESLLSRSENSLFAHWFLLYFLSSFFILIRSWPWHIGCFNILIKSWICWLERDKRSSLFLLLAFWCCFISSWPKINWHFQMCIRICKPLNCWSKVLHAFNRWFSFKAGWLLGIKVVAWSWGDSIFVIVIKNIIIIIESCSCSRPCSLTCMSWSCSKAFCLVCRHGCCSASRLPWSENWCRLIILVNWVEWCTCELVCTRTWNIDFVVYFGLGRRPFPFVSSFLISDIDWCFVLAGSHSTCFLSCVYLFSIFLSNKLLL